MLGCTYTLYFTKVCKVLGEMAIETHEVCVCVQRLMCLYVCKLLQWILLQ